MDDGMVKSDRGHEGDGDPGTVRNGKGTGTRPYDDFVEQFRQVLMKFACMKAMTYSPRSGLVYDLDIISQAITLFNELVINGDANPKLPVYLVAITCNTNTDMGHVMKKAYIYASRLVNQPLIGVWTDSMGEKFLDVVIPVQFQAFNSDEQALELGRKYEQRYILRLEPNGIYYPLKVH